MEYGKYFVIESGHIEHVVMFNHLLTHADVAQGWHDVISAGFFAVGAEPTEKDDKDIGVSVFGESVTLNLKVRKEDERLIKKILRKPTEY